MMLHMLHRALFKTERPTATPSASLFLTQQANLALCCVFTWNIAQLPSARGQPCLYLPASASFSAPMLATSPGSQSSSLVIVLQVRVDPMTLNDGDAYCRCVSLQLIHLGGKARFLPPSFSSFEARGQHFGARGKLPFRAWPGDRA